MSSQRSTGSNVCRTTLETEGVRWYPQARYMAPICTVITYDRRVIRLDCVAGDHTRRHLLWCLMGWRSVIHFHLSTKQQKYGGVAKRCRPEVKFAHSNGRSTRFAMSRHEDHHVQVINIGRQGRTIVRSMHIPFLEHAGHTISEGKLEGLDVASSCCSPWWQSAIQRTKSLSLND